MNLLKDSAVLGTFGSAEALAAYAAQENIDLDAPGIEVQLTPREAKNAVRAGIAQNAGDTDTLLGTTSDMGGLALLHAMASSVAETQSDGDFAEYIRIKQDLLSQIPGFEDVGTLSAGFLDKVHSGEVVIPITRKGLSEVFGEMAARSTAVSKALSEA